MSSYFIFAMWWLQMFSYFAPRFLAEIWHILSTNVYTVQCIPSHYWWVSFITLSTCASLRIACLDVMPHAFTDQWPSYAPPTIQPSAFCTARMCWSVGGCTRVCVCVGFGPFAVATYWPCGLLSLQKRSGAYVRKTWIAPVQPATSSLNLISFN